MAATVCGAVLSSLFYDQSGCSGDQEGLLLGKVVNQVKDTISDAQINNYKVETKIYIYSFLPQEKDNSFHNKKCQILESKVTSSVPEGYQIVGWYHSRRNSSPRMSMKETCIHRNLMKILPPDRQKDFLFLLCTGFLSDNLSTHTLDYNFYQWKERDRKFKKASVNVVNLGDTLHTEYKEDETCTVNTSTGLCASIVAQYESSLLDTTGKPNEVKKVSALSERLYNKLTEMTASVAQSERELQIIETKVQDRRRELQMKLEMAKQLVDCPDSTPHLTSIKETDLDTFSTKTKLINEEAINIARHKREQRRKEGTKYLTPRRSGQSKSKSDHHSPHTRRLSSDDAYEKDLICLDSEKDIDTSEPDSSAESPNPSEQTFNDKMEKMDLQSTGPPAENLHTLTHQSKQSKVEESSSTNADHFSFIEGVLAQARSLPSQKRGQGSSKESMTVPAGEQVSLPNSRVEMDSLQHSRDTNSAGDMYTQNTSAQRATRSQRSQKQGTNNQNVIGHTTRTRQSPRIRSKERYEDGTVNQPGKMTTESNDRDIKAEHLERNGDKEDHIIEQNISDMEVSSSPSF